MGFVSQIKNSRQHWLEQASVSENEDIKKIAMMVSNGQRRLADVAYQSIVDVSGKQYVQLFESQDKEEIGLKNIAQSRLEKGEVFMPTGLILLAGTSTAATYDADAMSAIDFDVIDKIPGLANGEFSFTVNQQLLIPRSSNQLFVTTGLNVPKGLYAISNPKMIEDNVAIDFVVRTKIAAPAKTALKLVLVGTVAIPG